MILLKKENIVNVIAGSKIKTYVNIENKEEIDIHQLFDEFSNVENETVQLSALKKMCNLTSDELYDQFNRFDLLHIFVKCLKSGYTEVQYGAAYILANIAGGNKNITKKLLEFSTQQHLITLLDSSNTKVRQHALRGLNNISAHFILLHGLQILKAVNVTINDNINPIETLEVISVLLFNMSLTKEMDLTNFQEIISILNYLVKYANKTITRFISKTLLHLSKQEFYQRYLDNLIDTKLLSWIVVLLQHDDVKVQRTALLTIENFMSKESLNEILHNENMLTYFPSLLSNKEDHICELAIRVILAMLEKNAIQKQDIFNANILFLIVENLNKGKDGVQLKSISVVHRMFHNSTSSQMALMMAYNPLPGLCEILKSEYIAINPYTNNTIDTVLLCLSDILQTYENKRYVALKIEEYGGLDSIHELQENANINYDSSKIIKKILNIYNEIYVMGNSN